MPLLSLGLYRQSSLMPLLAWRHIFPSKLETNKQKKLCDLNYCNGAQTNQNCISNFSSLNFQQATDHSDFLLVSFLSDPILIHTHSQWYSFRGKTIFKIDCTKPNKNQQITLNAVV